MTCTYPPPHITRTYPPPHMTRSYNALSKPVTYMYPPPHMTCTYPPPHMTRSYNALSKPFTCMYPPPHMTCTHFALPHLSCVSRVHFSSTGVKPSTGIIEERKGRPTWTGGPMVSLNIPPTHTPPKKNPTCPMDQTESRTTLRAQRLRTTLTRP